MLVQCLDAYALSGPNPNLKYYGWDERLGAGFEHPNIQESQNAYKMLSIRAWKEFSEVMGIYGLLICVKNTVAM